jgi:hypothetical protein
MKKLLLSIALISLTLAIMAQSPFKGFFKPVQLSEKTTLKGVITIESVQNWLFRPTIAISATKLQPVGGEKVFETSSFQSLGTGISYQKIIDQDGTPYCQLAYNFLILYNLDYSGKAPVNMGVAVTAGILNNLVSAGIGWDAGQKNPYLLLNISLNLNK